MKADRRRGWLGGWWRRVEDFHDALQEFDDSGFVNVQAALEFLLECRQLACQSPSISQQGTHFDESANDEDAHLNGARAIKDIGGHDRAMLGKGARENR